MLPAGLTFIERGWLSSNSLLLQSPDQAALFDTGYVTHSAQLSGLVKQQLAGQSLDTIINTHLHSDHCGGNALLQAEYALLQTHVPITQFETVVDWNDQALSFEMTGQTCPRFGANHGICPDQVLMVCGYPWLAKSSPGHDDDSLVFFQPDHGLLLSADALWESGFGVVFPAFLGGPGFQHVASTLDMIEQLKVRVVLPGHGRLFTDVKQALSQARSKLDFFASQPDKHALYAAKVLLKFKLMEHQRCELQQFVAWASAAPLLCKIHAVFFAQVPLVQWIDQIIEALVERKAMQIQHGLLINA